MAGRVKKMFLDAGYAIVSIDYRLAPETKLPDIIEDVEDAFKWIREKGPKLFHVDSSRIAVLGGSAGGYLALVTGHRVKPRPAVIVSFWGYGDLIGDWYSDAVGPENIALVLDTTRYGPLAATRIQGSDRSCRQDVRKQE